MIMTGEIPKWVGELARSFPFVLPFETRQIVFRVVAFDRDRAMHYMIDSGKMNEINQSNSAATGGASTSAYGTDSSSRFTSSKVDKRKVGDCTLGVVSGLSSLPFLCLAVSLKI